MQPFADRELTAAAFAQHVNAAQSILATPAAVVDQVARAVTLLVVPSLSVPVATKLRTWPTARVGATGVIAIATSWAAVTVTLVVARMLPRVALMVEVPSAWPVTTPASDTVATAANCDDQLRPLTTSRVEPSV